MNAPMFESNIPVYPLLKRGKVRDIYSVGNDKYLLIIATDRISAFDCVLPTPIPGKGVTLTQMSNFWFEKTRHIIANHIDNADPKQMDWYYEDDWCYDEFRGRAVLVRKAEPLPIEAIVRGYLAGSAWSEYKQTGAVCGMQLPTGLQESERLPEPVFTPSTKAPAGTHDENISFQQCRELLGNDLADKIHSISISLYDFAAAYAIERGIIIADTKFEFGLINGELVLIDELLTPDSSRFWPADGYSPGRPQPSFDKQYVRDYLVSLGWDKEPPAPELPPEVALKTGEKYREAHKRLNVQRREIRVCG